MTMTIDNWTTDAEGRYIGADGFVVPKSFAEFYELRPEYAAIMATNLLRWGTPEEREDLVQDIWATMLNNRMVEKFDPIKLGGANEKRFYWYLGVCVRRRAITNWNHKNEEPSHDGVSIDADAEEGGVSEEIIHLARMRPVTTLDLTSKLFLEQFRAYVVAQRPKFADRFMRVLDGLEAGETRAEIAQRLGVPQSRVTSYTATLITLAQQFQHRSP